MKVYLFYLKSDKSLYAFTTRKDYMKRFKKERNQKHYHYVKKELDSIQYQAIRKPYVLILFYLRVPVQLYI